LRGDWPVNIGKYELTQGQWEAVMGEWGTSFDGDDLPVEGVSWDDIQGFKAKTGLGLPTEAKWEYAARGGTETAFSFGSGESCADWRCAACAERDAFMWYCGNSDDQTHEVGTKAANAFGLHDVHGNVWEWCEDVYDGAFYSKPEAVGPDPVSSSGSEYRVLRGGSWFYDAWICRSALRDWDFPGDRYGFVGLRPAVRRTPAGRAPRTAPQCP
jgi:formylglycine-generating enzyme required for sulfatase activity